MPTQDTKDLIIARLQHAEEIYNNGGNAAGATDAGDYATYIGGADVSYDDAHTLELYFRAGTALTDALTSIQDGGAPGPIDPSNPDTEPVNPEPVDPQPVDPPGNGSGGDDGVGGDDSGDIGDDSGDGGDAGDGGGGGGPINDGLGAKKRPN